MEIATAETAETSLKTAYKLPCIGLVIIVHVCPDRVFNDDCSELDC